MRLVVPVAIAVITLGLAGCESSGSSLFSSLSSGPETATPQPAKPVAQAPIARIALAPVIGAPDAVSRQIAEQIVQSAERQRITMINDRDAKGDYTLRGYIVASKDRAQTKVSYIWDLTDPTGKRVNRVSGEELAPAGAAKDPWVAVTGAVTQSIADKTASQLATWLAANHRPAGGAPVTGQPPAPDATGAQQPIAAVAPPAAPAAEPAAARTTTASLPQTGDLAAIVPTVTGAPGDGNTALSSALQRELSRQGVAMANRPGASYRIEGKVVVGPGQAGKQSIQIDWLVRDPQGRSLGTVSQKNEIPEGSLDGAWGNTADAAAGAAAQGILKLLPQPAGTPRG
ncbi:MAG: hypothetical protein ACK4TL_05215 [Hyphomicrobiaceae bacterium]